MNPNLNNSSSTAGFATQSSKFTSSSSGTSSCLLPHKTGPVPDKDPSSQQQQSERETLCEHCADGPSRVSCNCVRPVKPARFGAPALRVSTSIGSVAVETGASASLRTAETHKDVPADSEQTSSPWTVRFTLQTRHGPFAPKGVTAPAVNSERTPNAHDAAPAPPAVGAHVLRSRPAPRAR